MDNSSKQSLGQLLGICRKAGKIITGTEAVMESIRFRKACIVLTASDVSDNTKKKLYDSCSYYDAAAVVIPLTMHELSVYTGMRTDCAAAAITDAHLAEAVKNKAEIIAETCTDTERNSPQNMEG